MDLIVGQMRIPRTGSADVVARGDAGYFVKLGTDDDSRTMSTTPWGAVSNAGDMMMDALNAHPNSSSFGEAYLNVFLSSFRPNSNYLQTQGNKSSDRRLGI